MKNRKIFAPKIQEARATAAATTRYVPHFSIAKDNDVEKGGPSKPTNTEDCVKEVIERITRPSIPIKRPYDTVSQTTSIDDPKFKVAEYYCCPKYSWKQDAKLSIESMNKNKSYSSILRRPFVFRRDKSLDRAVNLEEMRLQELYRQHLLAIYPAGDEQVDYRNSSISSFEALSQPLTSTYNFDSEIVRQKMREYAMMTTVSEEGEDQEVQPLIMGHESVEKEGSDKEESLAMRNAQKYLRLHRIFEFNQFLIAHLLSALPENPICFLLELLDKCVIYRAGMGKPPLLYEKKHLQALFNVMDRMKTGYIDMQQYITGMKTLGLCSFKERIDISPNGMIAKETFVNDATEGLIATLEDLIRRKHSKQDIMHISTPPPTPHGKRYHRYGKPRELRPIFQSTFERGSFEAATSSSQFSLMYPYRHHGSEVVTDNDVIDRDRM